METQRYQILIEGSSSTAGYSDESGKGGFAGRLAHHFWEYSQAGKRQNGWNSAKRWVYVHNQAVPGRLLPTWSTLLADHVEEILQISKHRNLSKFLGLFVIEAHPLDVQQRYGNSYEAVWQRSLETVEAECSSGLIEPVILQMPVPERFVGEKGRTISGRLAELTLKSAHSLDATIVFAEDIPGLDRSTHIAEDGMHPNAAGHKLLFRHMLPLVYEKLELKPLD